MSYLWVSKYGNIDLQVCTRKGRWHASLFYHRLTDLSILSRLTSTRTVHQVPFAFGRDVFHSWVSSLYGARSRGKEGYSKPEMKTEAQATHMFKVFMCLCVGFTPDPATVTIRITLLVRNPYKPSFATLTESGVWGGSKLCAANVKSFLFSPPILGFVLQFLMKFDAYLSDWL